MKLSLKKIKLVALVGPSRLYLTWIILTGFCFPLLSQNPEFNNYSIREGLPSTEVYEISQDSKGFLWFATDHGVAKFDGYEMKLFTVNDGLTDPVVFGISEDEKQRIWFRTYSGKLSILENGKIKPYRWNDRLGELVQNNLMYCLHPNNNELNFSTERYIGKIDSTGKVEKEPIKKNELCVRITDDKKLLYGFNGSSRFIRKIKINGQNFPILPSDTLNHNKVISGLQDGDKTILTLNSDIYLYDGTTLRKVFTGRSSIISFSKDNEGFYWVGYSNHGSDKIDPEYFTVVTQLSFLADKSITKVVQYPGRRSILYTQPQSHHPPVKR
jgi:ligand-binding sensor domain-containing protein